MFINSTLTFRSADLVGRKQVTSSPQLFIAALTRRVPAPLTILLDESRELARRWVCLFFFPSKIQAATPKSS